MRNRRSTRIRAMRRWDGFRVTGRGKIIEARRDADLSLVTLGSMTYVRAPFIARTPLILKFARLSNVNRRKSKISAKLVARFKILGQSMTGFTVNAITKNYLSDTMYPQRMLFARRIDRFFRTAFAVSRILPIAYRRAPSSGPSDSVS